MMRSLIVAAIMLLSLVGVASAHRLDEYLQATLITVEKDHVQLSMRLIPGVAVASTIITNIDSNSNGRFSPAEQQAYAERVLRDLSLSVDGHRLIPKLLSVTSPQPSDLRDGLGEIHIEFTAVLPPGSANRRITLENHTQFLRAAYLVNALAPTDPDIRILSQTRNEQQSSYQLDYVQSGIAPPQPSHGWLSAVAAGNLFQLGMHHIAEGTDHLLFLLVLLLPAPLLVYGSRWSGVATMRGSLLRILKIVTAFTIGHSITLALAALGFVHVPSRPIEVLIAVSILVSAIHALRPCFPGKEAWIAAFFGLIHGLAFAATLNQLGLARWDRIAGILSFNLGIETMQLVVVAATMPSLILMSRSRAYPALRVTGALFAGLASIGWITERLFNLHTPVNLVLDTLAHHAVWIAAGLFLISLASWLDVNTQNQAASFPASSTT